MSLFRFLILILALGCFFFSANPASSWSCGSVPKKSVLHYLYNNDVIFTGVHLFTEWVDEENGLAVSVYSAERIYKGLWPWEDSVAVQHKAYSLDHHPFENTIRSYPVGLLLIHASYIDGTLSEKVSHPCSHSYRFSNETRFMALNAYRYKWIPILMMLMLGFCAYRVGGIKKLTTLDLTYVVKKSYSGQKYQATEGKRESSKKLAKLLYVLLIFAFISVFIIYNLESIVGNRLMRDIILMFR